MSSFDVSDQEMENLKKLLFLMNIFEEDKISSYLFDKLIEITHIYSKRAISTEITLLFHFLFSQADNYPIFSRFLIENDATNIILDFIHESNAQKLLSVLLFYDSSQKHVFQIVSNPQHRIGELLDAISPNNAVLILSSLAHYGEEGFISCQGTLSRLLDNFSTDIIHTYFPALRSFISYSDSAARFIFSHDGFLKLVNEFIQSDSEYLYCIIALFSDFFYQKTSLPTPISFDLVSQLILKSIFSEDINQMKASSQLIHDSIHLLPDLPLFLIENEVDQKLFSAISEDYPFQLKSAALSALCSMFSNSHHHIDHYLQNYFIELLINNIEIMFQSIPEDISQALLAALQFSSNTNDIIDIVFNSEIPIVLHKYMLENSANNQPYQTILQILAYENETNT